LLAGLLCLAARDQASAQATGTASVAVELIGLPQSAPSIQIDGSASSVSVEAGAAITATVAGGPGNPSDWLGVYSVGAPSGNASPASWKWLSTDGTGTQIPAPPGVTSGTVHLVVPNQARKYEVRLFLNNSFAIAATSAPITVGIQAPIITVVPAAPQIGDSVPLGTTVASYAATMPDGTAFPGKVTFGSPYFDAGGLFALTGTASGNLIVSPTGPGLAGLPVLPFTEHITLQAVSPP
jgi:hypothetical protein